MNERGQRPAADAPAKSTLFCRNCGHRSRHDGDWILLPTVQYTRYVCPDCLTTTTVRPRFPVPGSLAFARRANRQRPPQVKAMSSGIRAWRAFWRASTPGWVLPGFGGRK